MKLSVLKKNKQISVLDLSELILVGTNTESVFLIGRSTECHVVLDDKQISREHSKLIYQNGNWRIEKISEDTPLMLNNESIQNENLSDGDSLSIGIFTIEISIKDNQTTSTATTVPAVDPVVLKPSPVAEVPTIQPTQEIKVETEIVEAIPPEEDSATLKDNITQEFVLDSSLGSATGKFEFQGPKKVEPVDEFDSFPTNSETTAELALAEKVATEGLNTSATYSLENISSDDSFEEKTKVFENFSKVYLELFGEYAPYDKFSLNSGKTLIGRDPTKCQIILKDPDVSSSHALIVKNNMMITLEDLNSGNGTLVNGARVNKVTLNHNDEILIGSTSLKVKVNSEFLNEEHATLMPVEEDQTVDVEEFIEVEAEEGEHINALGEISANEPEEKSIIKRIWKDEEKRKKALIAIVVLVGLWVFLDDQQPAQKTVDTKKNTKVKTESPINTTKKLSEEEKRALSERYQIGKKHFYDGRYRDALEELQKIAAIDPNFNTGLVTLISASKEGLAKLEEQEKKRKEEEAIAERKTKVNALLVKVTDYVKEHRVDLAQDVFNDIAKLDPENLEASRLKRELDDWIREKQKKELEIAQKKKEREEKIEKLKPGKNYFLAKEWFKASAKLDEFLKTKDMDEDLIKEASEMLKTSREEVGIAVLPLLGKSKSLMEGQDLKGAYEVYQQILKIEPSNTEALNAIGEIRETLNTKARKIYREAIISESLSLFQDAKDKFQEVQQVSPVDSDYYKKATDKLKDYLD